MMFADEGEVCDDGCRWEGMWMWWWGNGSRWMLMIRGR